LKAEAELTTATALRSQQIATESTKEAVEKDLVSELLPANGENPVLELADFISARVVEQQINL